MATFEFTSPEGKSYSINGPDNASREQAFDILKQQIDAGKGADFEVAQPSPTVRAGKMLAGAIPYLGRQAGLTARYGLEGLADTAQVVTEPLRLATDLLLPNRMDGAPKSTPLREQATKLADTIGLPAPETPAERVAAQGARMMAGTAGGSAGLASLGRAVPALSGLQTATNAMGAQLGGAAGAGLGGEAAKEAGESPLLQLGAATAGGLAGGLIGSQVQPAIGAAKGLLSRPSDAQIDVQIARVMGPDYSRLSPRVQAAMRAEAADALRTGREIDPVALGRLADFRAVQATPTRGMLTQDPAQITREQNLAKIQANSKSGGSLVDLTQRNNQAIIGRLNDLGGATETTPEQTGQAIVDAVQRTRAGLRGEETALWQAARAHPGIQAQIEPNGLNAINAALGDEALMPFMNPTISRYMEAFQTGEQAFTPQHYANLRSMLSSEMIKGGNEARAARAAVDALDAAPLVPVKAGAHLDFGNAPVPSQVAAAMRARDTAASEAVDLVNRARGATRAAYAFEESSPLVQTIVSGARAGDPDRIAASYLLNNKATVRDAERVAAVLGPEGMQTMKDGIATWIKKTALSQAADEVGDFRQSALNKVLNDARLGVFFTPEEVEMYRRIGRVSALIQRQPAGSAVNNSNTSGALIGRGMDMLQSVVPGTGMLAQPMRESATRLTANIGADRALNTAPALLNPDLSRQLRVPSLLGPAAALGGSALLPASQ